MPRGNYDSVCHYFYAEATEVLTSSLMQPPRVEIAMESLKYKMSDKTPTCRMKWLPLGSLYLWWNSEAGLDKVMTAETELLHEKSRGTAFELNVRV